MSTEAFGWVGVRVPHWAVTAVAERGKGGRALFRCVSRCGVTSVFRRDELAAGGTQTCEGCRPGAAAPRSGRVISEGQLPAWLAGWEGIAVEEKTNNLQSRKAAKDWDDHGRPTLLAMIDRTGLGRDFGWKAFVCNCHEQAGKVPEGTIRVRDVRESQRRIELAVRPRGGAFTFEVDLSTGRTDRPFAEVRRLIEAALNPQPAPPAVTAAFVAAATVEEEAPPVVVPPRPVTILGNLDLNNLLKMRAGFDTLISVGRDIQSAAELKAELEAAVAQAAGAAQPLGERYEAAAAVAKESVFAAEEAQNTVTDLNRKLQTAMTDRDRLEGARQAAHQAMDAAHAAYQPARIALETAKQQLKEAEQLEAERVRALGTADNLIPLLAALQKLGTAA